MRNNKMSLFDCSRLIVSVLLLVAVFDIPYGYYVLLRLVVTTLSSFGIYRSLEKGNKPFILFFISLLILFNPLIPIHFEKETWAVIDIVSAILILFSLYFVGDCYGVFRSVTLNITKSIYNVLKKMVLPTIIIGIIGLVGYYYYSYQKEKELALKNEIQLKEIELGELRLIEQKRVQDSIATLSKIVTKKTSSEITDAEPYYDSNRVLIGIGNISPEKKSDCIPYSDTGRIIKVIFDNETAVRITGFTVLTLSGDRDLLNFDESIYNNGRLSMAVLSSLSHLISEDILIGFKAYACGAAGRVHFVNDFKRIENNLYE